MCVLHACKIQLNSIHIDVVIFTNPVTYLTAANGSMEEQDTHHPSTPPPKKKNAFSQYRSVMLSKYEF